MPPGAMRAVVEELAHPADGCAPANGFWSLSPDAFGDAAKPPTLVVAVNDWVSRKLDAIRCHRSQMGAGHPFDKVTDEEARRWLGVEHFHRGAVGGNGRTILDELSGSGNRVIR